jgi:hypothetical protein
MAGNLTMNKIKVGVVSALLAAGLATVAVDVHANRGLHAELRALQASGENLGALSRENQRLNAALQKSSADNPEAGELVRMRQHVAVLKARPPGVLDGEMISAASWRDVGRAIPEAANMTFHWAMFTRDLDAITWAVTAAASARSMCACGIGWPLARNSRARPAGSRRRRDGCPHRSP